MNPFSKIKENLFSIFQAALIVLLIVLVVVFAVVLSSENPEWIFSLLGITQNEEPKYEVLKFLGIGMGGILIALQALMSYKRAKAMEKTAEAQADAAKAQADAVAKTEQGQRQDRLKNAIEHLGHESDSVRLGGAYELFHLAEDTEDLRQTVLDILCAHIRRTTGESEYREKHKSKPSEEIQSLLTLLFVQKHELFRGLHINLQESYLNGVDIRGARLERAILTKAHLQGTILFKAHLQNANFRYAYMQRANLDIAHLQAADFIYARLQGAQLFRAGLQGAKFFKAHLQGARLDYAYLQGADLGNTHLQGATFLGTGLQGATLAHASLQGAQLDYTHLQEANLYSANLQGASSTLSHATFVDHIRQSIGKETDLWGAVFSGRLSQEDVDSLVKDLPDKEKAKELREKLESHIGASDSNELPTGHNGPITGSYTKEEAEQWIAEYEQAMSEVPEDDS